MGTVFIIQSIPDALDLIKKKISIIFPDMHNIIYESNFEKTLTMIPVSDEIVVIASDYYHDDENIRFDRKEKDGSKLAEEIKKINSLAKVYIFSTYRPRKEYIDGFFLKSHHGDSVEDEIVEIFHKLNLSKN
jgi:hypothetical protein